MQQTRLAGLVGSGLAVRSVRWSRGVLIAGAGWVVGGLVFVAIGRYPMPAVVVAAAALAGVPVSNAAATAFLTTATSGSCQRAALAGQHSLIGASSSAGLLLGGPTISARGPTTTLQAAGVVIALVAIVGAAPPRHPDKSVPDR